LFVAVLALAACGKKGSQAPAGDCAASVDNAIRLSKEEFKKSGVLDSTVPKIRDASVTRCTEDKWSNEVLKCFVDAKSSDEVTKCQNKMTKEQNDNIAKAITAAMAAQDSGSGGSGSDTGSGSGSDSGSAGSGSDSGSAGSAAASGDMPKDCADYKAMLDKVVACDKLPQATRDAMKKTFATMEKSFATIKTLPEAQQKTIADGCKTAADTMKKAAGDACGL